MKVLDDTIPRASGPRPFRKSMFRGGPGLRRNIDLFLVLYENHVWESNMIIYSPSHPTLLEGKTFLGMQHLVIRVANPIVQGG